MQPPTVVKPHSTAAKLERGRRALGTSLGLSVVGTLSLTADRRLSFTSRKDDGKYNISLALSDLQTADFSNVLDGEISLTTRAGQTYRFMITGQGWALRGQMPLVMIGMVTRARLWESALTPLLEPGVVRKSDLKQSAKRIALWSGVGITLLIAAMFCAMYFTTGGHIFTS